MYKFLFFLRASKFWCVVICLSRLKIGPVKPVYNDHPWDLKKVAV